MEATPVGCLVVAAGTQGCGDYAASLRKTVRTSLMGSGKAWTSSWVR